MTSERKTKKLRCTRCSCRRSGRRGCCGCFSGGGSGGVYRRGWVSRPERTKYQSERGTCPLLAPFAVQIAKTHFAALCRIYRPCEILTGILSQPLVGCFARQPIRSEWVRSEQSSVTAFAVPPPFKRRSALS